jgi:hypothetical protein
MSKAKKNNPGNAAYYLNENGALIFNCPTSKTSNKPAGITADELFDLNFSRLLIRRSKTGLGGLDPAVAYDALKRRLV